jgi:hypothetical protein
MKPSQPMFKNHSLPVDPCLLVKEECLKKAAEIRREGKLIRLSERDIARELYFHACIYYLCLRLRPVLNLRILMERADPIDLSDRGDTPLRTFCYKVFWLLPGRRKTGSVT